MWAKEDRPLNTQVLHSFCYGLRWQLGEWGYPKQAYEIKEETWTFHASGIEVLQADFKDGQLEIEWKSDAWENWDVLLKIARIPGPCKKW